MNIKIAVVLVCAFFLATPLFAQAQAQEDRTESMALTVVDTLALLFLLFGAYVAWELYNIMKGGTLANSWGFLAGAVVIFALIKVIEVAERADYFSIPEGLMPIGYLFVAIFLFIGFLKQRRTLG